MIRTHVILDGLQDPHLGRDLSVRWAAAGFDNAVDVAGQCAWLAARDGGDGAAIDETQIRHAAAIARAYGLEIRDRAGQSFEPENDLDALRGRMVYEYKSRLATALMFGLPALALHYLGPTLAGGRGGAVDMIYPWLFELLLVGWVCLAAGWPILWQAALAAVHLRATADLLTASIIAVAFTWSAIGVVSLLWATDPWFTTEPGQGPMFYAADLAVILAVSQRWLAHRAAVRIRGRAMLMIPRFSRVVGLWLCASIVVTSTGGWESGLAVALIFPPMIGLGAINRMSPGVTMLLPVCAFALVLLIGPGAMSLPVEGVRVEIAAGFALTMTLVFATGWSRFTALTDSG
jgi:hypothetical protein